MGPGIRIEIDDSVVRNMATHFVHCAESQRVPEFGFGDRDLSVANCTRNEGEFERAGRIRHDFGEAAVRVPTRRANTYAADGLATIPVHDQPRHSELRLLMRMRVTRT